MLANLKLFKVETGLEGGPWFWNDFMDFISLH